MKILHTADLHIGCVKKSNTVNDYLDRAHAVITELLDIVEDQECDFLIVAGDWFDRAVVTHQERAVAAELFGRCPVPIISITGNHDRWGRSLEQTSVNWLTKIMPALSGHKLWAVPTAEEFEGVWWLALPYNKWNQADTNLLTDWLVRQVPKDWKGPVIGLSHEFYDSSVVNSGWVGTGSRYSKLPIHRRVDYWALGDIHAMQRLSKNAWYPGSPYQTRFDETLPKGVLVVDLERRPLNPEFIEITSPKPLVKLTEVPVEWPDAYVHLTCRAEDMPHPTPKCVVVKQYYAELEGIDDEPAEKTDVNYLLDGLPQFLKKKGYRKAGVKHGMKLAHGLIKEI